MLRTRVVSNATAPVSGRCRMSTTGRLSASFVLICLAALAQSTTAFAPCASPSVALQHAKIASISGRSPAAQRFEAWNPRHAIHRASDLSMELQFYQSKDLRGVNWNSPAASGNFGKVFYATLDGQQCVIKCPVLEEFSLRLFDTERAVNIKLAGAAAGAASVPWATMLGEVNVPESERFPTDIARIGIVWRKEGDGRTLEEFLNGGTKQLYQVLGVQEQGAKLLRVELSKNVLGQLLVALSQLQERGVMHRDVKPSNTLVVPDDKAHVLKIIDFGSCCDYADPFKKGLGDATCDPMYAPPEQTLALTAPGKFDCFSAAMTAVRVLLPSLTAGGNTREWEGGNFQEFAESTLPRFGWDLMAWLKAEVNGGKFAAEAQEALLPENAKFVGLLAAMLKKNTFMRMNVQSSLSGLGPEWVERARNDAQQVKQKAAEAKRQEEQKRAAAAKIAEEGERERAKADKEEEARRKQAEQLANQAAKAEEGRLRALFASSLGGGKQQIAGDKDIANVVPEDWKEGAQYFRSPKLSFKTSEIVVAFRSDGSRRFGKIMQVNGDNSYDVLVDRSGGEGDGQFRTDAAGAIGKIATTGRTLQDEIASSSSSAERAARSQRKATASSAQVGDRIPAEWTTGGDYGFSPTSSFKRGEVVVAARSDGSLRFGSVKNARGDGTYEIAVEVSGVRVYPAGSLGKIVA